MENVIKMKTSKLIISLAVFMLMVGCFAPIVLAKPKADTIRAVGKGYATYEGVVYPCKIKLEHVTIADLGTVKGFVLTMCFVLPDGTKITAVKTVPFQVEVGDDDVLQGFTLQINEKEVDLPIQIVKNNIYGVLEVPQEIGLEYNGEPIDFTFVLRFKIEIEGVDAGQ